MARRRRANPWVAVGEVAAWVLFALLLLPVGFAGWALGHYTAGGTKTVTVSVGSTAAATTAAATTAASTTAAASTAAATTAAAPATGGNAAKGKAVFASAGCASCHTFAPAGSSGTIGPNLDTRPKQDAKKDNNMPLAAFIQESIVKPDAYIASGYSKGLMPTTYGTQLSKSQLADLVAFLVSGAK